MIIFRSFTLAWSIPLTKDILLHPSLHPSIHPSIPSSIPPSLASSYFLCPPGNLPWYLFLKCLMNFVTFIWCTTVITTKFYSISIPNPQCIPPHPPTCESVSVLQRSSLCPFFFFFFFCLFQCCTCGIRRFPG